MITQVPELADGGYWYVVLATTSERGGLIPSHGINKCGCFYREINGETYCVVRVPAELDALPDVGVGVGQIISSYGRKPKVRFKGQ